MEFKQADHTVDVIIFRRRAVKDRAEIQVALIKRRHTPHKGKYAFVGGYLDVASGETLEEAARRESREEVSTDRFLDFKQFRTYSDPKRDPRKRVITTVFLAVLEDDVELVAGDDAASVEWFDHLHKMPDLAFDHNAIFAEVVQAVDFNQLLVFGDLKGVRI